MATPAGAVQEQFLPAGSAVLRQEPTRWFDITLPAPLNATGRRFVSVQVAAEGWKRRVRRARRQRGPGA